MNAEDPIVRLARLAWLRTRIAEQRAWADVIAAKVNTLPDTWTRADTRQGVYFANDMHLALAAILALEREIDRDAADPKRSTLIYWTASHRMLIVDDGKQRGLIVRKVLRAHLRGNLKLGQLLVDAHGRTKSVAQLVREYGREVSAAEFNRLKRGR